MKRFRLSRDTLFLIVLFLLFAGFTAFVAIRRQQIDESNQVEIPYSSRSSRDRGALGLYEWANALGYRTQRIENSAFRIGDDVRLLFILNPTEAVDKDQARYILQWVERGNVLYLSERQYASSVANFTGDELFRALDIKFDSLDNSIDGAVLTQPLMDAESGALQAASVYAGIQLERDDYVEYLAADKPILLRMQHGKGAVWVSTAPDLVTNENLRNPNNAKFARAILASVPAGSSIAFDEYHLGFKPDNENSLLNVLYNTPWGWGILFAAILMFGYLGLNGQRFGRTVPVRRTLARRTPSEYVVSMGNLFRRANKRGMVLQHYRHALKRRLGRPFHLSPDLTDDHYVELITRMRPEIDRAELVRILNGLRRTDTTEADLVKSIQESVTFGKRAKK